MKICGLLLTVSLFFSNSAFATDYSSDSFIVRDPVITVEGGRSSSDSFQFFSSTGQTVIGQFESDTFISRSGFLYFPAEVSATPVTPTVQVLAPGGPQGSAPSAPLEEPQAPPIVVTFSGKAYPFATVTLLRDARIVGSVTADAQASFSMQAQLVTPGRYIFSLFAEDSAGRISSFVLYPLRLSAGSATVISDILLPPTTSADKIEAIRGEPITITGQSAPGAAVSIIITDKNNKEITVSARAGADGSYSLLYNTGALAKTAYTTKARATLDNITSNFGLFLDFIVGERTIFTPPIQPCPGNMDIDHDCRVDLTDFSILIYWFDRPNPPAEVDLNGDGVVDLFDFSIMAYYWTG